MLVTVLLAGCVQDEATDGDRGDAATPQPAPHTHPNDVSACLETILFQPVEAAHAQSFLPNGYSAADVSSILGVPVDSGQAGVAVAAFACETSSWESGSLGWGFLGVFIAPPVVDGFTPEEADLEVYLLDFFTNGTHQHNDLAAVGHAVRFVELGVTGPMLPTTPVAMTTIDDAEGSLVAYETLPDNADEPFAPTVNLWHQNADGLAVWEFDVSTTEHKSIIPTCTIRGGGIVADALGRTDCTGAPPTGFVHYDLESTGRFLFLPGVAATA